MWRADRGCSWRSSLPLPAEAKRRIGLAGMGKCPQIRFGTDLVERVQGRPRVTSARASRSLRLLPLLRSWSSLLRRLDALLGEVRGDRASDRFRFGRAVLGLQHLQPGEQLLWNK